MSILSDRIKKLRNSKGITQKQISEYLGVQCATYQRFEYGNRRPSLDTLILIADFFQVSIDYLVGRTDNPKMII
jgi:transcriptional regulator with XRE-family HTH domain